jgi:hypothetical protein
LRMTKGQLCQIAASKLCSGILLHALRPASIVTSVSVATFCTCWQ